MLQKVRSFWASPLLWIAVYFGVVVAFAGSLEQTSLLDPWRAQLDAALTDLPFDVDAAVPRTTSWLVRLLPLLGALILAVPVVWIYIVTRRQEGYPRPFVQMLILLPVVVSGVVQVVRDDLALAFALAGIVAAVRFRTTVRDHKNAVFAFAVIGIGLATGSFAWQLGWMLSVFFCLLSYGVWRLDIGGVKPQIVRHLGTVRLSEALIPGDVRRTVARGDRHLTEPLTPDEAVIVPDLARKLAAAVRADAMRSGKKHTMVLVAYTLAREEGRNVVESILDKYAKRWYLVDYFNWRDDTCALEYLIRLRNGADVSDFLDRLSTTDGGIVRAVELKPIKGFRERITT